MAAPPPSPILPLARRGSSGSGQGGVNHGITTRREAAVDDSEDAASICPN
jgi:hypothetical protein